MAVNKAFITGNLTRDCELRQTRGGMEIASFTVAVNDRRKNADGEWSDYANYIDCSMFGTRAGRIAEYLSKGTKVSVEGKLRWSQWEKDGQTRSKVEIVVDEIEFMSRQRDDGRNGQQHGYGQYGYQQQPISGPSQASVYDDDLPF